MSNYLWSTKKKPPPATAKQQQQLQQQPGRDNIKSMGAASPTLRNMDLPDEMYSQLIADRYKRRPSQLVLDNCSSSGYSYLDHMASASQQPSNDQPQQSINSNNNSLFQLPKFELSTETSSKAQVPPLRGRSVSDGHATSQPIPMMIPPITCAVERLSQSVKSLSLKSITMASVSSGRLSMAKHQERLWDVSSSSQTINGRLNTFGSTITSSPATIPKHTHGKRDVYIQTDYVPDSVLFPPVDSVLAELINAEYTKPGKTNQDDDEDDEELANIEWVVDSIAMPNERPVSPDAETMAGGHLLGRLAVSPVVETLSGDEVEQSETFEDTHLPPDTKFRISAPSDCSRPKPRRFLPQQRIYVEYHPTSPHSSERTVPSETGSESSSSYFSAVPSAISSPDTTKIANLLGGNKKNSAFVKLSYKGKALLALAATKTSRQNSQVV